MGCETSVGTCLLNYQCLSSVWAGKLLYLFIRSVRYSKLMFSYRGQKLSLEEH